MKKPSINSCRRALAGFCLLVGGLCVSSSAVAAENTVTIGVPPWPGATIKSDVVATMLKSIGYQVKFTKASAPIVYLALSKDEADINMSAWSPGQAPSFMPYVKQDKIVKLGENLTGATAGFVVPDYLYKAGLKNDKQLSKFADKAGHRIYCIDPGSGANNVVSTGIKNNTYGLSDWTMKPSSTAAMLANAKRAIAQKKPIVFCGWRPHWMNIAFNIKFLKDPKNLWGPNGGHSQVFTLASSGFVKDNPNLVKFFRNFQVDSNTQSQWVFQASYKKQDHTKVATRWIKAHLDEVAGWFKGVKTADGKSAADAIRAHFKT